MRYDDVTDKMLEIAKKGFGIETLTKVFEMGTVEGHTIYKAINGATCGRTGQILDFYIDDGGSFHGLDFHEYLYFAGQLNR